MSAVWVVDDDESIRWVLEKALNRNGFQVRLFESALECLEALDDESPEVIVSDIRMPGRSGLELLERIKGDHPNLPVIVMTAYSDLDSAVSALQGGAFEYLPKPFDLDKAVALIERAVSESTPIEPDTDPVASGLEILGQAPAMQEVFRAIGRLAASNATVLITGESGTGKELVARALHDHSHRAGKPFIALNTAAIPRDLLESELFGHERGAFTGAQAARPGRFEQAEGGTLFLDEIGDMPAELQTRLLRVLSDGAYYRVGGHQPRKANVRVIAATHQDLEERVRQGLFREDLFHRLHVIRLRLPPLRERAEDIPLLARHFLQMSARTLSGETKRLSSEALAALQAFHWPGNVRQLENICHWLTVMAPTQQIGVSDLPPEIRRPAPRAAAPAVPEAYAPVAAPVATAPSDVVGGGGGIGGVAGIAGGIDDASRAARAAARIEPAVHETTARAAASPAQANWLELLEREVSSALDAQSADERHRGGSELMDQLTRAFETVVIGTALRHTRSRRIDAALRLGIGRNTITRKIKDLRLEDDDHEPGM
ncbi:MAG: nitrogen regulation protein NR(I) [Burkholderiaceae bacterium]